MKRGRCKTGENNHARAEAISKRKHISAQPTFQYSTRHGVISYLTLVRAMPMSIYSFYKYIRKECTGEICMFALKEQRNPR